VYTEFYGLKEEPFNITPDPAFLFFGRAHEEAFNSLLTGIHRRKGFLVVSAPIGTGKTTLCRAILTRLDEQVNSALIINPALSPTQLCATIIEDFGIEPRGKTRKAYFDALNEFLLKTARAGSTSVLIIDEAQNLKPKTLEQIRLLSNFETDKEKLLQIVLVGQPELTELLDKPALGQLRQRVTVSCTLEPLNRQETEAYILHRIRVAGGKGPLIFAPEIIDGIFEHSQGYPRLINILCDRCLMVAYEDETGRRNA
jgi:general secretion pathway protein A